MVHRGTARAIEEHSESVPFRPMFKFQFLRTTDPGSTPSWDHDPSPQSHTSLVPFETMAGPELAPVCQAVWEWMLGNQPPPQNPLSGSTIEDLKADLQTTGAGAEAHRVHAAFQLARAAWHRDIRTHAPLLEALTGDGFEAGMRAAMHSLGCGGDAVVPMLVKSLRHPSPLVAGRAAEALGEAAATPTDEVVGALCDLALRMQAEIEGMPPTVDWENGSNFLLETFQVPMLPEVQREAAARWCVFSPLNVFVQADICNTCVTLMM